MSDVTWQMPAINISVVADLDAVAVGFSYLYISTSICFGAFDAPSVGGNISPSSATVKAAKKLHRSIP